MTEEYFRFSAKDKALALRLKDLRHDAVQLENFFDRRALLSSRDTAADPFSAGTTAGERDRENGRAVALVNIRRAQEACRVIEEYAKVAPGGDGAVEPAKKIRFSLYAAEKEDAGYGA